MPALQRREAQPELAPDRDWWRGAVIYQIYPRSYQDSERRRHRRSQGHHRAAALHRFARRRRDLDFALLQVADEGFRLRRLGLLRRRSDVRHAGRFRRAGRRGAPARPARHDRRGDLAHRRHPSLVQGKPVEPQQSEGRLVRLGGRQAGRHAAQQLAVDLRRLGLAVGHAPPAILPAQFPRRAARPQLPQPRSPGRAARCHPLLAGARRRRFPARHDQLLFPQPGSGGQSAAAA